MSASLNWIFWKSDKGFPNCFLLLTYSLAVSRQKAAPPKLQLANSYFRIKNSNSKLPMLILPPSKPCMAILKPDPLGPIRFSLGTLQSSNITIEVGWFLHPIFSSNLPKLKPGVPFSTKMQEISFSPGELRKLENYPIHTCLAHDDIEIAHGAPTDEALRTVQHIIISLFFSGGLHSGRITSTVGFSQAV